MAAVLGANPDVVLNVIVTEVMVVLAIAVVAVVMVVARLREAETGHTGSGLGVVVVAVRLAQAYNLEAVVAAVRSGLKCSPPVADTSVDCS